MMTRWDAIYDASAICRIVDVSALRSANGSYFLKTIHMIDVLHFPDNETTRIDSIWVFLSIDDDGNEAVIAGPLLGPGSYVPLIAADERRLGSLTLVAEAIARDSGRSVRLIKFTSREIAREFVRVDDLTAEFKR